MKEIVFPPSSSPSFLTVPGEGFAEPFALNPGKWIIHIKAEGVLLVSLIEKTLVLKTHSDDNHVFGVLACFY